MKVKCNYCSSMIDDTAAFCPNCGAPNPNMKRTVDHTPKTIEELKQWYEARHLPPYETTRFFIGENYTGAKAFGIYKEGSECVVYKNKADGSRAVRYKGDDEAYAVNEIYLKLKSEILNQKAHNRTKGGGSGRSGSGNRSSSASFFSNIIKYIGIIFVIIWTIATITINPVVTIIAAAVPLALYFIINRIIRKKTGDTKRRPGYFIFIYGVYLVIMCIFVAAATPDKSKATYYSYNDSVYAKYDSAFYLFDPISFDYIPTDYDTVPPEVVSHPEDYEFNADDLNWNSRYTFEESDYYEENLKPGESTDSNYYDDDSDWDWDSDDSWDYDFTDWDSDW